MDKKDDLRDKLITAKRVEVDKGKRCYVVWSVPDNNYFITNRAPYFGEFYDSDGARHG